MSGLPPLLAATDLAGMRAAAAAEDRGLELGSAQLHDGEENLVLRTADGWILRFPRREGPDFGREVALLGRLEDRLPVQIPRVAWTGRRHRLMAYRAIDGASFRADAYAAADPRSRNRLAASIARFLAVLHTALAPGEIAELGVPSVDPDAQLAAVADRLGTLPPAERDRAEDVVAHFREAWLEEPRPSRTVLLHNGAHVRTMAFTEPAGELTGVWDFSCVATGPPSLDLRHFARVPADAPPALRHDLMQRIADQYARTGIVLDVDGARAAMAMERLLDAVSSVDLR